MTKAGRLLDDDVVGPVPHLRELLFERLNFIGIGGQDNTVVLVLGSRGEIAAAIPQ